MSRRRALARPAAVKKDFGAKGWFAGYPQPKNTGQKTQADFASAMPTIPTIATIGGIWTTAA